MRTFLFTAIFFAFSSIPGFRLQAQITYQVNPYQQVFDNDSLAGFDAAAAASAAITEQFTGPELKVRMSQLKRQYINSRFNLHPTVTSNIFLPPSGLKSAAAACVNEDFEASTPGVITGSTQTVSGWTLVAGSHTNLVGANSCNLSGCCPNYVYESAIISTTGNAGYVDPVIGVIYPIYSVFGSVAGPPAASVSNTQIPGGMFGTTFLRLNSSLNNYSIEKLSKTFQVSASNALFKFAFINVISCGHACCDASSFMVQLTNATTNSVISNSSYSVSGLSAACNNTSWVTYYVPGSFTPANANSNYIFNPWQFNFINLAPYMGQSITIDVIASDCTAGGHYSYTYFDAQCGSLEMEVNGAQGNTLSCVPTASVGGPANMPYYQWNGPGGFVSNSRTFTTATSGNYTLTLNQVAPLPSLTTVLPLKVAPLNLQVASASNTICEGQSVNLSASGAATYTWNTGSNNTNITVNPATTTAYTVNGTSSDGCTAMAVITQVVDACTGIASASEQNKGAGLFPNPNKGAFVLQLYENCAKPELIVTDALGKVILKQNVQAGENHIRMTGLNSGIYYYSVNSNNRFVAGGKFSVD